MFACNVYTLLLRASNGVKPQPFQDKADYSALCHPVRLLCTTNQLVDQYASEFVQSQVVDADHNGGGRTSVLILCPYLHPRV